jgi:phage shock protein A
MTTEVKHFDILEYVKKAKEYGIKEEFAEYSARQINQLSETIQEQKQEIEALKQSEPTTKRDIAELKLELIKWMIGIGFISITALSGVMFSLLKLMIH